MEPGTNSKRAIRNAQNVYPTMEHSLKEGLKFSSTQEKATSLVASLGH